MTDLVAFSFKIRKLKEFKSSQELLLKIYLDLARAQTLNVSNVLQLLDEQIPKLSLAFSEYEKGNSEFCKNLEEDVIKQGARGIQFVIYGEPLYPTSCYLMADPPLILSYVGAPAWMNSRSLSVVGSREPTAESLRWLEKELGLFCEMETPLIVSGGARGIDQKAHSVALRKAVPTAIVLPSGLGQVYPENLFEWIAPVTDGGGCIISEYDYSQVMQKYLFHHRNRLIAALGVASLLVEAKRKSGTLITAQQAVQIGRPVWVVPGHPQDPHFSGGLDLLSEGAVMVRDAQDLSMFFRAELTN